MASGQTANYGLNQWAAEDQVLREEFNRDNAKIDEAIHQAVPPGIIAMWSGAADAIPTGWALCDGQNSTPDLRGRFIVGAGGSEYQVGNTGGVASDVLTMYNRIGGQVAGSFRAYKGEQETRDNRPPYYALCYIMRQ